MKKTALVVGSGFGGIASALRLKALGYNVTLIERLDQVGGRARVFKRSGYTFDAGPTVITAPFLFDELFCIIAVLFFLPCLPYGFFAFCFTFFSSTHKFKESYLLMR